MLKDRILTALVLAVVIFGVVLLLPPWASVVLLVVVVLGGAWEWSAFLSLDSRRSRVIYVIGIAALLPLAWWATRDAASLRLVLVIASLWWLSALAWLMFRPQSVTPTSAGIAGVLALVPAWVSLAELRLAGPAGPALLLYAVILIVAADTGAYFAGRTVGRLRLAPRVSPGKTWEGAIGGVCLALLIGLWGAAWFGVAAGPMLVVSLAAASFSIVGDLTESMLKRHARLKDSGSLFPGHGGLLDRIDSVTAGAPVLLLGLMQLGVTG